LRSASSFSASQKLRFLDEDDHVAAFVAVEAFEELMP